MGSQQRADLLRRRSADAASRLAESAGVLGIHGALDRRMGMRITDTPQLRPIGPDLVSAIYAMHWDAVIRGDPQPLGGDNRVCATFRRTAAGWRFAHCRSAARTDHLREMALPAIRN
jgi:hypothetical protein